MTRQEKNLITPNKGGWIENEDDLLPISGLQHLIFCKRQCALIHIEEIWVENVLTAEGRILHENVHCEKSSENPLYKIEYSLPLKSLGLGLTGKADVVEIYRNSDKTDNNNESSTSLDKSLLPFPIEYKRGKTKKNDCDRIQLCAQALCLEEMMEIEVPRGALYYWKKRRRDEIVFDAALRSKTVEAAKQFHKLVNSGITPKPINDSRCKNCSLINVCLPQITNLQETTEKYLSRMSKKP